MSEAREDRAVIVLDSLGRVVVKRVSGFRFQG